MAGLETRDGLDVHDKMGESPRRANVRTENIQG